MGVGFILLSLMSLDYFIGNKINNLVMFVIFILAAIISFIFYGRTKNEQKELQNKEDHVTTKTFWEILVSFVIIILLAVGAFGWIVWHDTYIENAAYISDSNAQISSLQTKANQTSFLQSQNSQLQDQLAITNQISTWNTYTDKTYGFSVKYPSTWTYNFDAGKELAMFDSKTDLAEIASGGTTQFDFEMGVGVSPLSSGQTYQQYLDTISTNAGVNLVDASLNGISAKYYLSTLITAKDTYVINKGNNVYSISARDKADSKASGVSDADYAISQEIMRTFQFTK
jgi:hypothetical protein